MSFDPCREWLGIDALDLSDARRVLGIAPTESDPRVIAAAAERRLTMLAALAPGPFARARAALMERVTEARDGLLAELPPAPELPAPLPPSPVVLPWSAPPPPVVPPPVPSAAPVVAPQVFVAPATLELPQLGASRTAPRRRARRGGQGPVIALLAALAVAAAGLGGFMLRDRVGVGGSRTVAVATAGSRTTSPPDAAAPPPEPIRRPQEVTRPPTSETSPKPKPRGDTRPADDEEPAGTPPGARPADPVTAPPAPADADAARAIDEQLGKAFTSLRERDFAAAAQAVAAAGARAGDDPEAGARVGRWRLLVNVARDVPRYLDDALQASSGNEFDVGGTRIGVIEVTADRLIYRARGRTERVSRERAPSPVLGAILATWFANDGRADNFVFLGAFRLLADPSDPAGARRDWQSAARGGVDSGSHLLLLLDDPIVRGR